MKKILLISVLVFLAVMAFSQQTVKQRLDALNGINVTGTININNVPVTSANILQYNSFIAKMNDTITINDIITIPTIFKAAGDTSNYHTPGKAGNIFIDISSGNIYISKSAVRSGWVKLN